MAMMIPGLTVAAVIGSASKDVVVKGVMMTASGVGNAASYLVSSSAETAAVQDVQRMLLEEDVEQSVRVVDALVSELDTETLPDSVLISLSGVDEVLRRIEYALEVIKEKIKTAEQPYWYFWKRGGNFRVNIETMRMLLGIFRRRSQTLQEMLALTRNR